MGPETVYFNDMSCRQSLIHVTFLTLDSNAARIVVSHDTAFNFLTGLTYMYLPATSHVIEVSALRYVN
jgi:hypothetical protein